MIQPKANFVDRVEQSIVHLKNNLFSITLPITVLNVLFLIVIPTIAISIVPLEDLTAGDISQKLPMLISLGLSALILYILAFTFLLIPVQIAMIKTIKETLSGKQVNLTQYLPYGFRMILQAFKTYWYIFAYVYLIPALLFIIGGLIFIIATMISHSLQSEIMTLGGIIMGISVFTMIIFTIYRGTKATFGLISAIDREAFTKEDFQVSTSLSDTKWWRVFWNLFGIGFIVGCVINLISFIIGFATIFSSDWSNVTESISEGEEAVDFKEMVSEFSEFNLGNFIGDILSTGIGSMLGTLIVVFSYIYFLRLRNESNSLPESNKEIEL